MSDLLRLFPLPNVVFFPNVFLPLHVFEPRYREMVADALNDDRLIGMVLLRPGWERDYEGRPAVYPIGCSGVITHFEKLEDGRFNIILRGLERFRILNEDHSRSYRRASIESLIEAPPTGADQAVLAKSRVKLESLLAPAMDRVGSESNAVMSDADLIHALAQYLDLEPLEKQALLERSSVRMRAESLIELLEMKVMMARTPGLSNVAH